MAWTLDIQGPNGGATLGAGLTFASASITWTAEGPGAIEVDVPEDRMSSLWQPGTHRVIARHNGTARFAAYVEHLRRDGRPRTGYRIAGRGIQSVLDYRFVHKPYVFAALDTPVGEIAWQLIAAAQSQINGDMGFTQGSTFGTTVSRDRYYCAEANIGEEIRALAQIGRGFDYEVDPGGAFNVWNGRRGSDLTGTFTLTADEVHADGWDVEADTSEFVTAANAVGDAARPFGPQIGRTVTGLSGSYGRREVFFDVDTNRDAELEDAAEAQLDIQGGARLRVRAGWLETQSVKPWSFGQVWLGDRVNVALDSWFGGTQEMRCVDVTAEIEPTPEDIFWVWHTFDATVTDITTAAVD